MIVRSRSFGLCLCLVGLTLPSFASAADGPAFKPALTALPTNFAPGETAGYLLAVTNVGAAQTNGEITMQVAIPDQLDPLDVEGFSADPYSPGKPVCAIDDQTVTCQSTEPLHSGNYLAAKLTVAVPADAPPASLQAVATITGGDALAATTTAPSEISATAVPFDFLGPLTAPLTEPDGTPTTQAGAHPFQYTVDLGFPTAEFKAAGSEPLISTSEPTRDLITDLPAGLIANPAATPVRCTEAQLTSDYTFGERSCPPESQVGVINLTSSLGGRDSVTPFTTPLYNMVPPPGAPAQLAFDAAAVGIYIHLIGGVRSESDYGAYTETNDALALAIHPFLRVQAQIWGDPSATAHEHVRGEIAGIGPLPCFNAGILCPVEDQPAAFLTAPADCPGIPITTRARADSWTDPGLFKTAAYESADLQGNSVSISGCSSLPFEPTISVRPTTNLIDSPSGLDVSLRLPTDLDKTHRSPAPLRDATVTLPPGMVANPSQADGRAGCSLDQIGFLPGADGIHFSKAPNSCPDAAKLGTVTVTTPLLAQYTEEDTKRVDDPETHLPIPEPLHGSVYLAEPFANPFNSLLAIYLAVEDPKTGTIAKLAGKAIPDPATGQLTTVFEDNPQLPIEDIDLHLFGGPRASLITPPNCATHTTTTDLIPWSAPQGPTAHPESSFQTTAAPGGEACPSTPGQAPNAPSFSAGTTNPQAGAYSPFVLKLSREDGSARLTGFDTLLPPGLTGKLAGVGQCSDVAIAQAAARSNPDQGILERNSPSCPVSSKLGTVTVAAGAGPTPFHTQGTAYLAGPYKGAPLSMAVITPAIAGPFDLGVVVVRAALYVDRETTQIHAVSDPFPTILHGIPLDLRSVAVNLDRLDFTLNPTSCDEMAITGGATSVFNQVAPLTSRFQVGGCPGLAFKPKFSLALKGSTKRTTNPRLIADVKARPGDTNVAKAQVTLPKAAFLDNSHIKTICTRVQFSADTCPSGSIYGKASASSPLLDYEISGPVYLRSSNNLLPDLVVKLKGPASQPIEVDLVGRTDSVKGALRNTFTAVPDAPVSRFHLELFGGKRGLVELSGGLCKSPRASVKLDAQNGKAYDTTPKVKTSCKKRGNGKSKGK